MPDKNLINIPKKSIKWVALFLLASFLFIIVISSQGRAFRNKTAAVSAIKNKNFFGRAFKPAMKAATRRRKPGKPDTSINNLKDIFDIPRKKYKRFNQPFIPASKTGSNATNVFARGEAGRENLPNFIKGLKFKGFQGKKPASPSLIFISGKTALLEIGGRSHYVRAGENIGGMFILKIGLTGVSYSHKGKIKHLSF